MSAGKNEVLVEHEDGIVVITLTRPGQRNAVNGAMSHGVCAAVDELDARDDLRVGILTGAGGTFFVPASRRGRLYDNAADT